MVGKSARYLIFVVGICASLLAYQCGAAENAPDASSEVGVVGATGGILTVATVEPDLNWPILLRRNDAQAGAKAFQVNSSLLVGPGGKVYDVQLLRKDGAAFDGNLSLDPHGQAQLQLVGKLPEEGEYTAELRLIPYSQNIGPRLLPLRSRI